jgi:ribosomal protein L11 methylase PrmA
VLYRYVAPRFAAKWSAAQASGVFEALTAADLIVPFDVVDAPEGVAGAHAVLQPLELPFMSWPWEWSFSALKQAAITTLAVAELSLDHGMVLKDATAFNIQFQGTHPLHIDTLSLEPYVEGAPWVAYQQFCQHFLAPLALAANVDHRLIDLSRVHVDGIPLDLAARLLPWKSRFTPALGMHIHAHAKSIGRHADSAPATGKGGASVSKKALRGMFDHLRTTIEGLEYTPAGTEWGDYYANTNYSEPALEHKARIVADLLPEGASMVWDVGANTGRFSRLALDRATTVVAFDIDPAAVEHGFVESAKRGERRMLHLRQDLTNPSSGYGWASRERDGLVERGPADAVMALALIHHLAIGNNVPLPMVAEFLSRSSPRAIVEWVPKSDSQVQRLLASRDDIFDDYTEAGFEAAMSTQFSVARRVPVPNTDRVLFSLERH